MPKQYEPEHPKPFDFVPFADHVDRRQRDGHERLSNLSGSIAYTIQVVTMVHVSSGTYALSEDLGMKAGSVLRDHYRVTNGGEQKPAIPGSSLKGAIRSITEAVTPSCIGITRVERKDLPSELARTCRPPQLCPACGIFGAMSYMGRVRFHDALYVNGRTGIYEIPALYRPRARYGNAYRDTANRFVGRKFYYHGKLQRHTDGQPLEVMAGGTTLRGAIAFNRLSAAELGLLLFSLGIDGSFDPSVGAGKPIMMGQIRFVLDALDIQSENSFVAYDEEVVTYTDAALTQAVNTYLGAGAELLLDEQTTILRKILKPNRKHPAPTGVY